MKTKIKRHSRSVISVLLAVCMLVSCMTVGIIATNAAKLTGDSAVAAKTDDTAKVGAKADSESVGASSTAKLTAGDTYYLDVSSFSDKDTWITDKVCAVFFYQDNTDWCIEANNSTYDGSHSETVTRIGSSYIYKVTVPSGYNVGALAFYRCKSDNTFWNAVKLTADDLANYNCIKVTGWNTGSAAVYVPTDTPVFSLVGNISSDYIVGSSIAESSLSNDTLKWGTHYSAFDVNSGSAGVYSITFTTVADLGSHNSINIGLFMDGIGQYGFKYNGTDYNSVGADLTIPSTGVSSGLYVKKGQGSIVLQANTTYTITIDQTDRTQTGCVGKMTITETPSFELHLGTTNVDSNWAQAKAGDMTLNGSVYEYTASLSASTYGYYVTTYGAGEKRGLYYKSSASSGTHSATLGTAESVGEYLAKEGSSWGGSQRVFKYTPTSAGDYKFTFDLANKTLKIERVSASSSNYSLTGNIDTTYLAEINGVTNTISRGTETDAVWWAKYQTDAAISTVESGTDVYSITVKTVDYATLKANGHDDIDIGLSMKGNTQKGFNYGGTDYNVPNRDYKVTSAGMTNASIIDATGGSFQLQPDRTYKITINEGVSPNTISVECTSGDKYFLAGQYSDGTPQFFGYSWNTANNELPLSSGTTYTKTFSTANQDTISAGTITFKVVKNGDSDGWDGGSYPANGNQTYVIKANPTSVTFTFDSSNNTTTVTQTNSGGGQTSVTGWMYSGTAAANRTEVDPTSGMSTFDATKHGQNEYGDFRFMYGTTDSGLNSIIVPEKYKLGDNNSGNAYWADVTSSMTENTNFFICLSNTWNKNAIVGNDGTEINDSTSDKEILDKNNQVLFKIKRQQHGNIHSSIKYILIYSVDWTKVSAIGVKAYDNSKATNSSNPRNNKVDYQIYYKAKVAEPVVEAKTVDIVAKNGTLRDSTFNRFTNLADTNIEDYFYYSEIVNGTLTEYNSISDYNTAHSSKQIVVTHNVDYGNSNYDTMTNVPVGAKIKISTELSPNSEKFRGDEKFSDTHYLKAYSFNGMTYKVFKPADGVATTNGKKYTEEWTVRAVNTTYHDANDVLQFATQNGNTVEVTPIYYMQDNKNCKTFYIDGYDGEVQNAWGNMLAVYPYYENVSGSGNAFGGYPGQPMLFWGGKYQMEIPLTVDGTANGASVKGLTLHNGYWDLLHRSIDIRCNARNHAQTYDYDDFYKLYKEKNPDTIIFDFKYRTAEDNYGDGYDYTRYTFADNTTKQASNYTGNGHNGVEILTDYFGRQVDAFGTLIADANKSHYGEDNKGTPIGQTNELLFVSTGYKDTYVGEYATLWAVYAPDGSFIGYISSSMLYLNNWDRRLQYTDGDSTANGRMSWAAFQTTYNTLKTSYTGVPALISYEKEIWNDSKDKANRSDGKWYYSNKSDKVEASIKIQYGSYTLLNAPDHSVSSSAWIDDPFDQSQTGVGGEKNIGTSTGCSAYFTNTNPNLLGHVESGEQFADSTKSFTFEAVAGGSYMFAGWVRYSNGKYYEISESEVGESPMSANDVYIARFVDAQTGSLTIQHVVEQTDTFNGTGTPSITVHIKNNGTDVTDSPITASDGSKIDISKWIDSHFASYTIDISLTTTPSNESFMKEIVSSSGNFAPATSTWNSDKTSTNSAGAITDAQTTTVAQFTVQSILDSGVTSLRYVSHLMKPLYTYNYEITYTYTSRFYGVQSFTQKGVASEEDYTGIKTGAVLNTDFIINKTPFEKNFRKEINWNYTNEKVGEADPMVNTAAVATEEANTYKMTAHVYSSNTVNDKVSAEFILPYDYLGQESDYAIKKIDVYENNVHTEGDTDNLFDTAHESVKLETQAYKLFTADGVAHDGGDDVQASTLRLLEAPEYLITNDDSTLQYHYKLYDDVRYYTGNSFKVGDTTYYLYAKDIPAGADPNTHKVLGASDSVTFRKAKYQPNGQETTYHYAVADTSGIPGETSGAVSPGEYGYKIYFFSYVRDDETGAYKDNEGNDLESGESPIFNGQYCVYSVKREIDGIVKGTGVKKYFTRWDISNTKGEFVASCYNRRFNFSGFDNYVVRPVYASDSANNYASSTNTQTTAAITYLGDTRNQWNNGDKGDYDTFVYGANTSQNHPNGDKLIHDFALAYSYNGEEIRNISSSAHTIKIGMVIEQVAKLDSAGGTKISDASYYADKYKGDVTGAMISSIASGAASGNKTFKVGGRNCINSKIGANVAGWGTQFGSTNSTSTTTMGFDSVINNFNRLQWYYTFTNTKTGGTIGENNNANFVYRAWAYIIVDGTATVSSTPSYFTLYDSASR